MTGKTGVSTTLPPPPCPRDRWLLCRTMPRHLTLFRHCAPHRRAYVMFDWDNHFGSLMLSLDAKELGYSSLIQV